MRASYLIIIIYTLCCRPETIRKVLGGVYVDKDAVDDELVDIILAPAFTPNALDVFVSVITGGCDKFRLVLDEFS
jgi:hypothetical protein